MAELQQNAMNEISRRLSYGGRAYSFIGSLKCTFDLSMPLNITDLAQPFLMVCESPPGFFEKLGWIILGICGVVCVFGGLCVIGIVIDDWIKARRLRAGNSPAPDCGPQDTTQEAA